MGANFVVTTLYWSRSFIPVPGAVTNPADGPFNWIDMAGAIYSMCRSPYFHALRQHGAGDVLTAHTEVAPDDPPARWRDGTREHGFTDEDIRQFIVREIREGRSPRPDGFLDGVRPIHLVVLPRGLYSKDHFMDAVGVHYDFRYEGVRGLCTWVMQGGSLHDTTEIVSHELVEVVASELGAGEIADDCVGSTALVDGVLVQAYKSAIDGNVCVIPGQRTDGHDAIGYNFVLPHDFPGTAGQPDWRYCGKCHGLFFDGYPDKGRCPVGGGHSAIGFNFALPYNVPATPTSQTDWRYCAKCHELFFDGYPDKGRCRVDGGHVAIGHNFALPHDIPATPDGQPDWRYCGKCHGMFFDGYKGACPGT
jgi:hypothetical protein